VVCQFQEVDHGTDDESITEKNTDHGSSTFAIANLHLPARPSNILGRLKTMSRTVQKLASLDRRRQPHPHSSAPLDGLLMVAGDFNSDQHSVATQLLKRGSSPYGNLRDRNYKAKVTKSSALEMRHAYRFQDVYETQFLGTDGKRTIVRDIYAPITVSLKGQGPGCMDHLFYAVASSNTNGNKSFSHGGDQNQK
jgi:hypothetical protein